MKHREQILRSFRLYAVTSLMPGDEKKILPKINAAYRGGVDIIQLRSKHLPDSILLALGKKIRRLADRYRKLFFVNDRPDLALAAGADGIHLGQEDLPVDVVRRWARSAGRDILIGKSTHSLAQFKSALKESVDYLAVGPVFQTPTKKHYVPVGLGLIRAVSRLKVHKPVVAIGGIDVQNACQVLEAGVRRLAVVRAVFSAKDPRHAARTLKEKIESYAIA